MSNETKATEHALIDSLNAAYERSAELRHRLEVAEGKVATFREDWASWIENWTSAVTPEPCTPQAIVEWLRSDSTPFGCYAAEPTGDAS